MHILRQVFETIGKYKKSVLLIGPRQTGKSTLMRALEPDLTINLADESTFVEHLRDPQLVRKKTHAKKKVFIDEVQRIPSLLNTVQALIDEEPNKRVFLLTGSSARKLKRGQANLLPGRVLCFDLGPLTCTEIGEGFDIDPLLRFGALPGVFTTPEIDLKKKILRSYSHTYLREEVQAEALTRNLEGFSRFFDVVAGRAGEFIDFTKFSSLAGIERTSSKRYYEILVDTLILNSIEPFAKSGRRRLVQHPKYYFFDVGVLNGILNNFVSSSDRVGLLFEHLVLQMIKAEAQGRDQQMRITTYRTEAGSEVDFIIETEGSLFAVEVKATKKINSSDLRGLKSFRDYVGKKVFRGFVVYRGSDQLHMDGFDVVPLQQLINEIFKS